MAHNIGWLNADALCLFWDFFRFLLFVQKIAQPDSFLVTEIISKADATSIQIIHIPENKTNCFDDVAPIKSNLVNGLFKIFLFLFWLICVILFE